MPFFERARKGSSRDTREISHGRNDRRTTFTTKKRKFEISRGADRLAEDRCNKKKFP